MTSDKCIYEFGQFRLDPAEHFLLCDGVPVPVTGKAFQVLLILVKNSGHLVEKSEIVTTVWGDTFVEEGNLAVTISTLRKILGDDRTENRYIETIARQGYRFLPSVNKALCDAPPNEPVHIASPAIPPERATRVFPIITAHASKRIMGGATLLVAIIALVLIVAFHVESRVNASKSTALVIHSLAILPFDVTGSDESAPHIGMGIEDDLITRFGETDRIEVRPASAMTKYTSGGSTPSSVGGEQNVDAVISGAVAIDRGQAHLTAKLFRSSGETIWAGTYDVPIAKISELEDQIEAQVVRAIYPDRDPLPRPKLATRDPEAFQLYIEGRYFWNKRTENGFHRSIELFQQAILKDPNYADAYAGLADSYTLLASYGVEPAQEAYPNAKASAMKALQLDDTLAEAHTSLGMVALYYEWDWQQADREFRRAIELNPTYPLAHTWDALYFSAKGQMSPALQQAQRGLELDPLSLIASTELGRVYYWDRQYDKAISSYRHAIELDPYFARAHTRLGMALAAKKDFPGAIREFQEASRLSGPDPYLEGLTGYAQALGGDSKDARNLLTDMIKRSRNKFVPAFSVALLYIGLGDRDRAMDWLERADQDRSTYMVYAKVDPLLESLRSDQRFIALMKRMDLQGAEVQIASSGTETVLNPSSAPPR
jgi:DNA-binding winged helix-turn-helix (wHTH) protein/tetratricopeptide (TPR) repeat protein/TolB-like protein